MATTTTADEHHKKVPWKWFLWMLGFLVVAVLLYVVDFGGVQEGMLDITGDTCPAFSNAQVNCTFGEDVVWADTNDAGKRTCINSLPRSDDDYILWYIDDQSAMPHKWVRGQAPFTVKRYGFQAPSGTTRSVSYHSYSPPAECK